MEEGAASSYLHGLNAEHSEAGLLGSTCCSSDQHNRTLLSTLLLLHLQRSKEQHSPLLLLLLLLLVCREQADPEARFSWGKVLGLHAAHETSQLVQLLFGQRVGGVIQLQVGARRGHTAAGKKPRSVRITRCDF